MFISVTTIPAAAALGLSLAYESWSRALGSTWQLLLNVGLLIVVGAFALRLQRRIWRPRRGHPCRSLNLVIDVASRESAASPATDEPGANSRALMRRRNT